MKAYELSDEHVDLLRTLLEFHRDNDEPGEYYPADTFDEVMVIFGVETADMSSMELTLTSEEILQGMVDDTED